MARAGQALSCSVRGSTQSAFTCGSSRTQPVSVALASLVRVVVPTFYWSTSSNHYAKWAVGSTAFSRPPLFESLAPALF